jgi:plastocyanin
MRTIRLLAAGLTILAVAACATSTPGWTYAPPSASAVPSADASASAAPSVSAAPSASAASSPTAAPSPTADPSPTASAAPSGSVAPAPSASAPAGLVEISAQNIAFSTNQLSVAANLAFMINFANNDAGIPHNIEIKDGAGVTLFNGDIFNGVETRTYSVEPLSPGTYQFLCSVHPNMVGTLTSQ